MAADAEAVAAQVSRECGLAFEGRPGSGGENPSIILVPSGHSPAQTFSLQIIQLWRSLRVSFEQGAYSGELINEMGRADETGRNAFAAVLAASQAAGATIQLTINNERIDLNSGPPWGRAWSTFGLVLSKGQLPLGVDGKESDNTLVATWSSRVAACLVALLPLEDIEERVDASVLGLPEGAVTRVEVNRYERDRRNRAAALAIHGFNCIACGVRLSDIYGEVAADFIEVHHVTPVSEMGANYRVNPARDLVPLCPNCHAIVHRSSKALTIGELKDRLAFAKAGESSSA